MVKEPLEQLPLSQQISHRSNSPCTRETAPLAIHRRAQQWHTAGQCTRVRLLSSARAPNAERPRVSFRDWQRNVHWERPDRSGRSLAAPNQRRTRAQRLFKQHFARYLSGGRLQSGSADTRTARIVRRTYSLPARTLRQDRQGRYSCAATSGNESAALGYRLSRRRVSLLLVPEILVLAIPVSVVPSGRHLRVATIKLASL